MISGVALFIAGGIIMPFVLLLSLVLALSTGGRDMQFLIPGSVEFTIEEPGKYYLWNDYRTIYEGETYSKPTELPDNLTISLRNEDWTVCVDIVPRNSISVSSFSSAKQSIGYFKIPEPGDYVLDVQGRCAPRVFSFGESGFDVGWLPFCGVHWDTSVFHGGHWRVRLSCDRHSQDRQSEK